MAVIDQAAVSVRSIVPSKSIDHRSQNATPTIAILAFIGACAMAKLFAARASGFTGDEAYTIVISRSFQLSYFDHPPLHQWIVHGFGALFGEGWWLCIPFLVMAEAINLPLYGLTRRLFGRDAALWALFGFNATVYFVVWPDGLILPDVPLFLFLATGVWAIAEILFGPARRPRAVLALWLLAGAGFGFAGLSKYAALFAPIGLLGFLAFSPRHRHWFWRPQSYLAAALALAVFSPALIWNYQNDWVSFAFQSGRAASGASVDTSAFAAFGAAFGAQVALLSPWVGVPLVMALAAAVRSSSASSASRFLSWLVAVPLVLFLSMPFMGKTSIPHWFNSAWLFAFPLLGHSLSKKSAKWLRSWAQASAALTAGCFALFVTYVTAGPFWQAASAKASKQDPTQWSYNWRGLTESSAWRSFGAETHAFIVVDNWRVGGKTGAAFGPDVPVCAFSQDPREFAFVCHEKALLGQDALIVIPKERSEKALAALAPYFKQFDPSEEIALGRGGRTERIMTLTRAHVLLRSYPLPFGDAHQKL